LNSKGKQEMVYVCPIEKKKIIFESHQQLDEYCHSLFKTDKSETKFLIEYPEDYHLLKAYDRAFWMVYLKLEKQIYDTENVIRENENDQKIFTEEQTIEFQQLKDDLVNWKEKSLKVQPLFGDKGENLCFFKNPNFTGTL
jgi:hypothetical protein